MTSTLRRSRCTRTCAPSRSRATPVLLARAVRNLLENGIRHNVPGGEVWVRCRRERGRAVIEVENTGAPITPATVELLTEPFYRGDASRTSAGPDGTGLGLAIVQSITKTHGGEVRLRARKGGGLIATLALPVSSPSSPTAGTAVGAVVAATARNGRRS